jgi:hypothetical protein
MRDASMLILTDIKREWAIRKVLRKLSRQRVVCILQPSNTWVIENSVLDTEDNIAALNTCHMRGWVEILDKSVPKGQLNADGSLPEGNPFTGHGSIWKLTDSGWAAIHRAHEWTMIAILIAILSRKVPTNYMT